MSETFLRLGAIGAGATFIAYERAVAALPGVRLTSVLDVDRARRSAAAAAGRNVFSSLERFLEEPLDAVLVLAPHGLHALLVEACLEQGLDTLCEKPLATSPDEAERLLELAEKRGAFLYTAMHCRERPEVRAFGALLTGRVVEFEQVYREDWGSAPGWYFDPGLSGGGVLLDVGINQIDWILPFAGPLEIEDVSVDCAGKAVDLECHVVWRHSRGRGCTDLSWRASPEVRVTRLTSDTGQVFELDHRRHALWRDGVLQGVWPNDEYSRVLCDFLRQRSAPGERRPSNAPDLLLLLQSIYARAGLPFLSEGSGSGGG